MKFINNTIVIKKLMASAGIIWFIYIIFHAISLLNFHSGEAIFNEFYTWFGQTIFYKIMFILLVAVLLFHMSVAIFRQLSNNISAGEKYKKTYPGIIPRYIAWSGAIILFVFIVLHTVQMTILVDGDNLYNYINTLFSNPLLLLIYFFGVITLITHLHHGLCNVLQTMGLSSKVYNFFVLGVVSLIALSFLSIPISTLL